MDHATAAPERIYIGGLDPPRLSPSDILKRIQAMNDRIEIVQSKVDDTKPYLHIEAVSKDSDESTALEIMAKQYHNVKWKGCKVLVEAARPHFLKRLEEERRERQALLQQIEDNASIASETENHNSSNLPRRLRVRKKFGEEAFHIDTKPWSIDKWSEFPAAKSKLEKRAEKYHEQLKQAKKQPNRKQKRPPVLLHRAVHIRFDSEENGRGTGHNDFATTTAVEKQEALDVESESSSSDDEESSSLSESEDEQHTDDKDKSYEWSDSDDDGDESEEVVQDDEKPPVDDKTPSDPKTDPVYDFPSDEESSVDADEKQATVKSSPQQKTYQWSSDEDGSDDEYATKRTRDFMKVSTTDEFAAGFDGMDVNEMETDDYQQDQSHYDTIQTDADLKDDVTANLGILSSLFPDLESAEPAAVDGGKSTDAAGDSMRENNVQRPTIIARYDPTAEPSKQDSTSANLQASEDESEDSSSVVSSSESDLENGEKEDEEAEDHGDNNAPTQETVYEQDKLEGVFRDARDAWNQKSAFASKAESSVPAEDNSNGAFTFGFNLGDSNEEKVEKEKEPSKDSGGFSFGFDLPSEPAAPQNAKAGDKSDDSVSMEDAEDKIAPQESMEEATATPQRPRRRGFEFPEEDLNRYLGYFYDVDGDRPNRNNEDRKEAWLRERHSLTLDWKRKRKYAMTRIQKRLKTR